MFNPSFKFHAGHNQYQYTLTPPILSKKLTSSTHNGNMKPSTSALRHVEAYSWRRLGALLGQRPSQNPLNRRLASTNAPKKPTGSTSGPSSSPTPTASAVPDTKLKTADSNKTKTSDEDEGPQPLIRPLGVALRPSAGDNTGIDPRSWKQRRDDFLNYDKHLVRRKELSVYFALV